MNNPTNPLLGDVNDPRSLAYEFAQTEAPPAPPAPPAPVRDWGLMNPNDEQTTPRPSAALSSPAVQAVIDKYTVRRVQLDARYPRIMYG